MSTNLDRNLDQQQAPAIESPDRDSDPQLEAIELPTTLGRIGGSAPADGGQSGGALSQPLRSVKVFWSRQISIITSHDECRDHFGGYCLFVPVCGPTSCLWNNLIGESC